MNHSLMKYFLSEEDEKFKKMQKGEGVNGFMETIAKLVSVDDYKIKEMKLDEPHKHISIDKNDEQKLNMFLDTMNDAQAVKTSHYD